MIRVLIADDQEMVRECYCALLRREPDIQLVGEAHDGQEALDLIARLEPDVVTMDLQMPHMNGMQATRGIRARPHSPPVLVVASLWEDELVQQALDNGASGFVAKADTFKELVSAIREVSRGKRYFSDRLASWRNHDGLKQTD